MKQKKFSGKLKLNKKTIAHLDNGNMNAVHGGLMTEGCPSWIKTDCTCETIGCGCPTDGCTVDCTTLAACGCHSHQETGCTGCQ